jgi:hypothetical protein
MAPRTAKALFVVSLLLVAAVMSFLFGAGL